MARCGLLPLKGSECTKLPALPEAAFTERVILQVAQNMLAELREHRSWAQAYQRVTLPDTRVEAPVELPTTTLAATLLAKVQSNESRLQAARSKLGVGINAIGATGADAAAAERAAEAPRGAPAAAAAGVVAAPVDGATDVGVAAAAAGSADPCSAASPPRSRTGATRRRVAATGLPAAGRAASTKRPRDDDDNPEMSADEDGAELSECTEGDDALYADDDDAAIIAEGTAAAMGGDDEMEMETPTPEAAAPAPAPPAPMPKRPGKGRQAVADRKKKWEEREEDVKKSAEQARLDTYSVEEALKDAIIPAKDLTRPAAGDGSAKRQRKDTLDLVAWP